MVEPRDNWNGGIVLEHVDHYDAWNQQDHVNLFGGMDGYSTSKLVKVCSQLNEFQLVRTLSVSAGCKTISDVGCATGRFYRYFHQVCPSFIYKGFDISQPAIRHAKAVYPEGDFRVFDGNPKSAADINSDIVFCRDVAHHQANPSEFLSDLYDITGSYLILRVRTREKGATVFDVNLSCQYIYDRWVPYIVFNTCELMDLFISFTPRPARITALRHPVVLGGMNNRYLPKELYYPDTGTAETALLVEKVPSPGGGDPDGETMVTIETRSEALSISRKERTLRRVARLVGI